MEITVEDIFNDFKGRREGFIEALTTDVEVLYSQCDPERENLCLYGYPDETWEVKLPDEGTPPEYPDPTLGINFARDGMRVDDWLLLVAAHSDAWLLALSFHRGSVIGFGKNDRERLFQMINDLPTLVEVLEEIISQDTEEDDDEGDEEEESEEDDDESAEGDIGIMTLVLVLFFCFFLV